MEFVFWIIMLMIIIGAARIGSSRRVSRPYVVVEKRCPPHRWDSREVKDKDGNTLFWQTFCHHCGPLRGSNDEDTSD